MSKILESPMLRPFDQEHRIYWYSILSRTVKALLLASIFWNAYIPLCQSESISKKTKPGSSEEDKISTATTGHLNIAVIYSKDKTGERYLRGISDGIAEFAKGNPDYEIEYEPISYRIDSEFIDGLTSMARALEADKFHLILGPTDSDVFINIEEALEKAREASLEKYATPVISSNVVSSVGNLDDDWRFKTNVEVSERAKSIYLAVNALGHRNIAVLFENSEYGTSAEKAFRKNLSSAQQENYISSRYETLAELREGSRWILETRPSAIGIFGQREQVSDFVEELPSLVNNSVFQYQPFIFTPIDVRSVNAPEVNFVTVLGIESSDDPQIDDVYSLAYDTTLMVLYEAMSISLDLEDRESWSREFRRSFLSTLRRPSGRLQEINFKTEMDFRNGVNQSDTSVMFRNRLGQLKEFNAPHPVFDAGLIKNWWDIRYRRFGIAPVIGISIVLLIAIWITVMDVKHWRDGYSTSFSLKWPVIRLMIFNSFSAVAVVIFAAETGMISWLSMASVLTVAIGYRALLKSSLVETAQGQAIGFGRIYDAAVESIQNSLMRMKYKHEGPPVNFIAYTNTPSNMRRVLESVYSFANSKEQTAKLIGKLNEQVEETDDRIEQRKIYARFLINHLSWTQLIQDRLVPAGTTKDSVADPLQILSDAAAHCFSNPERRKRVAELVQNHLEDIREDNEERYEEKRNELHNSVEESATEKGRLSKKIEWLLTEYCFDLSRISGLDLLPNEPTDAPKQEGKRAPVNEKDRDESAMAAIDKPVDGGNRAAITGDEPKVVAGRDY